MARKKDKTPVGMVAFDVFYEDGSRASNRKVPAAEVSSLDGETAVRTFLMGQDRKIAELSGKPMREIKQIVRSGR